MAIRIQSGSQATIGPNTVTDGLVLYLDAANTKSYVSGSTTWTDLSSGGNNSTLTNGPTFNNANGGSIVFDGINEVASIQNFSNFNLSKGIVNIWFYPFNTDGIIFSQYLNDLNRNHIQYVGGTGNYIRIIANASINLLSFQSTTGSITQNSWNNVNYLYDYDTNYFAIYVNGYLNSSTVSSVPQPSGVGEITIACGKDFDFPPSPYYYNFFNGNISQVQIYNKILSDQEILQNYNATRTRFGI
jgi:hypothetical protein